MHARLSLYIAIDRKFSDLVICFGCLGPFCKDADCETALPRPASGFDRCGGDVPPTARACIECGTDWRAMSPLTDEDNEDESD
jgi:hypothetical protein